MPAILKDCPFCGGEAEVKRKYIKASGYDGFAYRVRCSECHAKSPYKRNPILHGYHKWMTDAVEAWNRRVTDESI